MLGKPKFKVDDKVSFSVKGEVITGCVYIVDAWGTFEDDSDVSYDIFVDSCEKFPEGCLYKHIKECNVIKL